MTFKALFCTGNESVEAAISYVFTNLNEELDQAKAVFNVGSTEERYNEDEQAKQYKMTFVVNTSLKMGIGKIAAQVYGCHQVFFYNSFMILGGPCVFGALQRYESTW